MRRSINKLISKIKGEKYIISDDIPLKYLISIMYRRLLMLIRGSFTSCKKQGYFFRGSKVKMYCKSNIQIGKGVSIDRGSYLDALSTDGIIIGDNSSMGKYTVIECSGSIKDIGKGLFVGNNVSLGANGFFGCAGGISVGDNSIMGNFVSFHSENHIFSSRKTPIRTQGVNREGIVIGKDCWIGAKVTILDGAVIEDGCIIAAGALLTNGKYEAYGIYGGIPAKLIKFRKE
ncbi:acyltransferase [Thalassobellus sediminis]|uniref:acyltransferase n=1 Tax=Thalassobellus sediminis TaxID=3367753 RepID=UPI0037B6523E